MLASKTEKTYLLYLKAAVMIVLMFGFSFLPPFLAVTPIGMKVLGVFIGWLFGICFLDIYLPCLTGMIAIIFSGAITTADFFAQGSEMKL